MWTHCRCALNSSFLQSWWRSGTGPLYTLAPLTHTAQNRTLNKHTRTHTHAHAHIHIHIRVHAHTHAHTHTRAHTQSINRSGLMLELYICRSMCLWDINTHHTRSGDSRSPVCSTTQASLRNDTAVGPQRTNSGCTL